MTPKEAAYQKISQLVNRFDEQIDTYKKGDYNEAKTRQDFINPFFKALGWDIDNEKDYAESYREVIYEDKIKVGGATKAPDYSFRIGNGKRLFFVEAKKPSVYIKDEILPAYQVRRYGWSAKLAVSLITDFEEFAIYDCTKKPNANDKASVARIKYITYKDYLKEFDFLYDTFSRDAVLRGSFDKFVQGAANKKGTATVDKEFLESLNNWRTYLATSISWKNKNLNEDEINFVVQQTIDRFIFLRIAEDRHIEPYGSLKACIKTGDYYNNLFHLCEQADAKYNSGLFDFKKDTISKTLVVDNKIIKTIINELYYPESPYEFSVLPVEILGSAYEQFLGKVIRITPGHIAKVEDKPEVRKAGGVYYTPQYIVEYIVKNTVGKLMENKNPKEVANIKIVDPACGSGSFLIGAYQYLMDWHLDYYSQNLKPSKGKKDHPLTPDGRLTTAEKKRILLNNIYGVDIDVNAVEVTKLSLLLKCMEGETEASIASQFALFHERVLPTLDDNIKDGNSLIDTDYYSNELDLGFEKKIKPFNWQKAFPEVFKGGGFDAVIGNPPYLKERGSKEIFEPILKSRIGKLYHQGKMDFWYYFVHRGIDILVNDGYLGFITNSYWMKSDGSSKLIDRIKNELTVRTIVDFDNYKVFEDVSGKHNIAIFSKGVNKDHKAIILSIDKEKPNTDIPNYKKEVIENKNLVGENGKLLITFSEDLFTNCDLLEKHFDTSVGVQESTDKITRTQNENSKNKNINVGDGVFVLNESEIKKLNLSEEEKALLKPYVNTSHIKKYGIDFKKEYLLYLGKTERDKIAKGVYPNIKKHLDNLREFITSSNAPYGIHRTREQRFFEEPKLICKGMFKSPEFYYDDKKYYCGFSFSVIIQKSNRYDLKLLLGLMNSNVGEYWFNANGKKRGIGVDIGVKVFRLFPLPKLDSKNFNLNSDEIIKLVTQILKLNEEKSTAKLPTQLSQIEGKISYCETRINEIVYQLYELTDDEIKIIEGK